jgi:hypothetical protein
MARNTTCYQWTGADKGYYFLSLIPFAIGFVGAAYILATVSLYLVALFVGLYIVTCFFQAGACVGCPYRGRFCTALFGIYLANVISSIIYKNRSFEQRFFNINAQVASIAAIATFLLPIYWLFVNGWYYMALYLLATMIHLFLFYRLFCPKCGYSDTCPGGRTVHRLSRR